jgi:hypothetical protein
MELETSTHEGLVNCKSYEIYGVMAIKIRNKVIEYRLMYDIGSTFLDNVLLIRTRYIFRILIIITYLLLNPSSSPSHRYHQYPDYNKVAEVRT